ncbi:uncharacterized protein [Diadema antillarum]|uniref:uncharacterized protein n=1 Tax=Diadema antillarum TaxID=105358 RepID=UPI003A8B4877
MDKIFLAELLLLTSVICGHIVKALIVGTAPTALGWKGGDIRLLCDIQEEPEVVYWEKVSTLHKQQLRTTKARFVDGKLESREERFDIDENFSLVISELEVADEGFYYCQVVLKNLEVFENSTFMTIGSTASKHIIEECVDKSQSHQSRCIYQTPANTPSFNLTCVVSGFKPNISMLWTDESGKKLDSVNSQQQTLSDHTYQRFETITFTSSHCTEQTFTCVATGDSVNGTSTAEIILLPIPGKRDNLCLIIGIVIGVPIALAILILLVGKFLQPYHPEYLRRKGV